jgi:hypothetical protein
MDNTLINKKKYPKSNSGKDCLGPCYEPMTRVIHPITLDFVTHKNLPFCPTDQWEYKDPNTGKKSQLIMDICMNPTSKNDIGKEDTEMNILIPKFNFNCEYFLKYYYKLDTFDQSINWLKQNQNLPFYTKLRIFNCALKAWGTTEEFIISDDLINFYIIVLKKKWIKEFYSAFQKYILIDDNKISIAKSNYNKISENVVEKTNFIIDKIFTSDTIYKIISKYHDKYYSRWQDISIHSYNIKQFTMDYLERKLIETTSQN